MGGGRPGGGTPARDITGSPDPASIRPGSTGIPGESGSAGGSGGSGGLPGDDEDFLRRP
jgi:hypothetical protein